MGKVKVKHHPKFPDRGLKQPETKLERALASNSKKVRDKAFRAVKVWLQHNGRQASTRDFAKLMRGLFYCMWHSDKPAVQEALAKRLADLIFLVHVQSRMKFVAAFYHEMMRQWPGIDRYRMNKFLLLVRLFTRAALQHCAASGWALSQVQAFAAALSTTALSPLNQTASRGQCLVLNTERLLQALCQAYGREEHWRTALFEDAVMPEDDEEEEAGGGSKRTKTADADEESDGSGDEEEGDGSDEGEVAAKSGSSLAEVVVEEMDGLLKLSMEQNSVSGSGLQFHMLDVLLPEFERVWKEGPADSKEEDSSDDNTSAENVGAEASAVLTVLLTPVCDLLVYAQNRIAATRICSYTFDVLIKRVKEYADRNKSAGGEQDKAEQKGSDQKAKKQQHKDEDEDVLGRINLEPLMSIIHSVARSPATPDQGRGRLYRLHTQLFSALATGDPLRALELQREEASLSSSAGDGADQAAEEDMEEISEEQLQQMLAEAGDSDGEMDEDGQEDVDDDDDDEMSDSDDEELNDAEVGSTAAAADAAPDVDSDDDEDEDEDEDEEAAGTDKRMQNGQGSASARKKQRVRWRQHASMVEFREKDRPSTTSPRPLHTHEKAGGRPLLRMDAQTKQAVQREKRVLEMYKSPKLERFLSDKNTRKNARTRVSHNLFTSSS